MSEKMVAFYRSSVLVVLIFLGLSAHAQITYYSRASTAWNLTSTWSTVGYGGAPASAVPIAGDIVNIGNGNSVTVTAAAACATLTIDNGATLNLNQTITVSGTTTVNGTLSTNSTAGTKTFTGLVTVGVGGTWNEAVNEAYLFQGGITNNGTFTAGTGLHTFNTNSQSLSGTLSIPNVTVSSAGVQVTNNGSLTVSGTLTITGGTVSVLNNGTVTVGTALSGTGTMIQGSSAILNIGGTSGITNMTATASGNTVNYTGAAQTVHSNAYVNLGLSGSGAKTLQVGTTSISGNLTLGGSATTTAVAGLTIGGNVTLGSGTGFTAGAFTHNIGGNWTNNGSTFAGSGSTINLNGSGGQTIGGSASTTFDNLSFTNGGTKVFGLATTIAGTFSVATGVVADLGTVAHTANMMLLGGSLQINGTWGGTGSGAPNINTTFFAANVGTITVAVGDYTYYSRANTTGDWNDPNTWSTVGHGSAVNAGTFPGATNYAVIGGNSTVNVTANASSSTLSFDAGTGVTNTLNVNSGITLTVSGAVTIPQTTTSGANILNVGAGNVSAASLAFTAGGGAGHQLSISTGTATITGDITGIGVSSTITFSGAGLLQVGGAMFTSATGTLTAPSGTVEYNGAAQTVQALPYRNLTLSGSGNKTLAATTTIAGNLVVGDNTTFIVGAFTLTVNGTTTVGGGTSGTLSFTSATGTKTFTGQVTISTNGTWSNTANEAFVFQGGITNNGTFTAGTGVHTFNTNSQILGGTSSFSIPSITVTGGAVVLTNNTTLTVSTALSGTGRLTQGAGATLNLGGTSGITNMTATASGNTVNYNGAAQTIKNVAYDNLTLSGSGVKTLQVGTTSITGDLTLGGSASTTAVIGLTIGDDVILGSGTSFTAGAFTHNVAGDWLNNGGSFTGTGSVINFNGTAQNIGGSASTTFNDVLLSGSGTKTFAVSTTIGNELSIASGASANLSDPNVYSSNTLILAGALQGSGTWGSSASSAVPPNQNDTFFSGNGELNVATGGFTYYSIDDNDWNLASTWSTVGFAGPAASSAPTAGDYVIIGNGRSVSITGAQQCEQLLFDAGTGVTNSLTITSGSLTVGADIIIPQTVTSGSNSITVTAGTLSADNLTFTASGGGAGHQVNIGAGTVTISGDITGIGASSTIAFTGAGLLQVGGAMFSSANGTLTTVAGSTVEYNGAAQTVQALSYRNLTLSGSGNKTLAATTTIGGNLLVGDNTNFIVGAVTLTVSGTTTVGGGTSGTLSITSLTGAKTFTGLVTINTNGTWSNTANEPITFQGGITNNGTFTAGTGTQTFNAAQTLNGTISIPNMTVTGPGVFAVTNNGTLTVTTSLLGADQLTQASSAVLNLGGTSSITTLNATASDNTVNFSGAAQTINNTNYFNLTLSNSGVKTLQAGTSLISGNLTLTGTASTTAAANLSIGGDLNIGAGTVFTAGAFDHTIGGNWINDGTFNHSSRRITFSGTTTQTIEGTAPTTFFNLHIAEGPADPDVQLDQTVGVNLVGEMTFDANATFDADGSGNDQIFTIISTATEDGRIGPLTGTADVTGNVTVQRYMDNEGLLYRYISTPVANPTAEDLQGEIPITGPFTGSSFPPQTGCTSCAPCTGCVLNNQSMYVYDETIVAGINFRYTAFPASANSETMTPGRGYAVYIRNNTSPTTWDLRGPLNKGVVDLNPSLTGTNDGFNLVGNPYASPIDWESGAWTRSNIGTTIYIWDNSINNYASYTIGGASTNGGSRYIASGQAFWVQATTNNPDLQTAEGIKASQAAVAQATFFLTAKNSDHLRVRLIGEHSSDELLVRVNNPAATLGYDAQIDSYEFPSDTLLSIHALTADKKRLAVNTLGIQTESTTEIQVGLLGTKPGQYKIDFSEFENFTNPTSVYLYDRFTDTWFEALPSDKVYSFTVTEDLASSGDNRLILFLAPRGKDPIMVESDGSSLSAYPNPATDRLTIRMRTPDLASAGLVNTLGVSVIPETDLIRSGMDRTGQFDLSGLPPGIYIIQVRSGKNMFNKRIVKQ